MERQEKTFLVLPGCDDTNRGDQALIWETVEIAREAGFAGEYYMVASAEKSVQSKAVSIHNIDYILPHPSSHFRKNNNIHYGLWLKVKWATVAIFDTAKALALLLPFFRRIAKKTGSQRLRHSLDVYERADAAFVKGGGFIHAYGGIVSSYAVFYDLYHIILALSMGIDVYVMPNSYGPFLSIGSGKLVKAVLGRCKLISSRESKSQKMLHAATGLDSELFPDLAFFLTADPNLSEEQQRKLQAIPLKTKKCVALTVRPYRFPASEHPKEDYCRYKDTMAQFVRYLSKEGYHPVIIEHTYSDSEHEQDISCIKDLADLLGDSCSFSIYSDLSLNCRQLRYVYSQFEYIIGTRFHSVIFSIASSVPAIAIAYGGNKGIGIMQDMGLDGYALDIASLSFRELVDTFSDLVQNQNTVRSKIDEYLSASMKRKNQLIQMIGKEQK